MSALVSSATCTLREHHLFEIQERTESNRLASPVGRSACSVSASDTAPSTSDRCQLLHNSRFAEISDQALDLLIVVLTPLETLSCQEKVSGSQ
jgi:hypothetical protein